MPPKEELIALLNACFAAVCRVFPEPDHIRPETADYTAIIAMYPVNRRVKAQTVQLPSAYTVNKSGKICTEAEKAGRFFSDKIEYT